MALKLDALFEVH